MNPSSERLELLPCPFCGHQNAPKITDSLAFQDEIGGEFDESNAVYFAVVCDASKPGGPGGCGAMGGFSETVAVAVYSWNLRAALSTQPQQAGWMPIESAPKDGTEIVGWSEAEPTIARFVRWAHHLGRPIYPEAWATRRLIHITHQPTHWMPLPPVPGQEGEQR